MKPYSSRYQLKSLIGLFKRAQLGVIENFDNYLLESADLPPSSFIGFMFAGSLVGGVIILKDEVRHWYEFLL